MALSRPYATEVETTSDTEEKGTLCVACITDGESRRAVKYCLDCNQAICQSCVDSHRRIKQIKDHKLVNNVDKDAMEVSQFLFNCLTCPNHPGKTIELVCKQHGVMCCITCATVSHRGCSELTEITSEATTNNMDRRIKDLIDHLDEAKEHMGEIVKLHENHNKIVESQVNYGIPAWLADIKANIRKALATIEKCVLHDSSERGNAEIDKGNFEISKWNTLIRHVDNASTMLKSVQENGSDVHVYTAANNVKKTVAVIDKSISNQGNQVQRQSIALTECFQLKQVYLGNPKEIMSLSVENVAYPLPQYRRDMTQTSARKTTVKTPPDGIGRPFGRIRITAQEFNMNTARSLTEFFYNKIKSKCTVSIIGLHA